MSSVPLILITNDDGIASPGLHAAVKAVADLGEVWIVAPRNQQSSMSRSLPNADGIVHDEELTVDGRHLCAFSLDTSPAGAVLYAMAVILPRPPALAISGINYGENVGSGVTTSGTVGAALEAASWHIPSLAVSLETESQYHYSHSRDVDFGVAAHITRRIAQRLLARPLPPGVDILKADVPSDATLETPWRVTRISRQRYFHPLTQAQPDGSPGGPLGYEVRVDPQAIEPDSDIHALVYERAVSISPMTIDLSAHGFAQEIGDLLFETQGPV